MQTYCSAALIQINGVGVVVSAVDAARRVNTVMLAEEY